MKYTFSDSYKKSKQLAENEKEYCRCNFYVKKELYKYHFTIRQTLIALSEVDIQEDTTTRGELFIATIVVPIDAIFDLETTDDYPSVLKFNGIVSDKPELEKLNDLPLYVVERFFEKIKNQ